jgi:hypothetical protein
MKLRSNWMYSLARSIACLPAAKAADSGFAGAISRAMASGSITGILVVESLVKLDFLAPLGQQLQSVLA